MRATIALGATLSRTLAAALSWAPLGALFWAPIGTLALGCGGAAGPPPAQTAPRQGQATLYIESKPERAYREVGLVQAMGTGLRTSRDDVLRLLRHEGRRLGCDAIVNVSVQAASTKAHAVGVCVRWAEPTPNGAPGNMGGG
jgi:hypothetical protein